MLRQVPQALVPTKKPVSVVNLLPISDTGSYLCLHVLTSDSSLGGSDQAFQHVELHIVDSDEEAAELRKKFLGLEDQNVHLLACAKELKVEGLVPTQMDAMAGNTPLFTYVLSTDYMGAAQEIARSLVSGVEAAQQEQLERQEQRRTRRGNKNSKIHALDSEWFCI